MINTGDIVRTKIEGRSYLARVISVCEDVECEFLTNVPRINGCSCKVCRFEKEFFREHGRAGIDHILEFSSQ